MAQLRAGSQAISARSRPHKVGPQEIESTPWVHTAGYLRARFVNSQAHKWGVLLAHQASSLSNFQLLPNRLAASQVHTLPSPHVEVHNFPSSLLAVAGHRRWCQACPQVAVATGSAIGSAKRSQAHEQPGPQAHGRSISKPHKAESGSTSSHAHKLEQGPNPRARSASSNVHMARRQACPQAAIYNQVQIPS